MKEIMILVFVILNIKIELVHLLVIYKLKLMEYIIMFLMTFFIMIEKKMKIFKKLKLMKNFWII